MIGKQISHYRITDELGRGGMGIVYRADDVSLGRTVAVKFLASHLTADTVARERLMREARAAASLRHDSICAVYGVEQSDDGQYFIVMPYYEGETLREILKQGPLPEHQAVSFARQISSGLAVAHQKGLVHRDIKPGNILVTTENRIKILDFGLAKLVGDTDLTATSSTVGTMAYMSPEQVQNHPVDGRTDLWSTGVVLYEMLTGEKLFSGQYEAAVVYGVVNLDIDLSDGRISESMRTILEKLLSRNPNDRFATADDLVAALSATGPGAAAEHASVEGPARKTIGRTATMGVVAAIAVVVILAMFWWRGGSDNTAAATSSLAASSLPTVAVMYIENNSERERLGFVVQDMLARNLGQVDSLYVMSNQRLKDILRQELGESHDAIDAATASVVARQAGIATMIMGSVVQFGEQYVFEVELTDAESGTIIDAVSVTSEDESGIMTAINELTNGILSGSGKLVVGESGLVRIQDVSTDDLSAYELYEKGMDDLLHWRFAQAAENFQAAIDLDSTFVAAYIEAANVAGIFGFQPLDDNALQKSYVDAAYRHMDHASEYEHDVIEVNLAARSASDYDALEKLWRNHADRYPDNKFEQLSAAFMTGDSSKYVYYQRLFDLDPGYALGYNALSYSQLRDHRHEAAISSVRRYQALQPEVLNTMDSSWEIMTGAGREEQAIAVLDDALGTSENPSGIYWRRMYTYAIMGDTAAAWSDWRTYADLNPEPAWLGPYRASHIALASGDWEKGRLFSAMYLREARRSRSDEELVRDLRNHAVILHAVGRHEEAERLLQEMNEIGAQVFDPTFNPVPVLTAFETGRAYAEAGDLSSLSRWIGVLEQAVNSPGMDLRHQMYLDILLTMKDNVQGQTIEAARRLEKIPVTFGSALFPSYIRLDARLAGLSGDLVESENDYNLLEHNIASRSFGVEAYSSFFIQSATARYQKARMYEDRGDTEKAAAAYMQALDKWRRTGATFRFVQDAEDRLARLTTDSN